MSSPHDNAKLKNRLKRIEGQVAGVRRMLEADKDCVDVLMQISAIQGGLERVGQILLADHIEHCVSEAFETGDESVRAQTIAELIQVFGLSKSQNCEAHIWCCPTPAATMALPPAIARSRSMKCWVLIGPSWAWSYERGWFCLHESNWSNHA